MYVYLLLGSASYSTLLIGYYHGLLLQVVDSDLLTDEMCSVGLLTVDEQIVIDSGCSMYQRNRLLLEHVRRMNVHALLEFCKLLHNIWPQIGMQLITGLSLCACLLLSDSLIYSLTYTHVHTYTSVCLEGIFSYHHCIICAIIF